MARTTAKAVRILLARDYDDRRNPSLSPHIDTASALVDKLVTCAAAKGVIHSDSVLELIERWLAAFFYTRSDPIYSSRSSLGGRPPPRSPPLASANWCA